MRSRERRARPLGGVRAQRLERLVELGARRRLRCRRGFQFLRSLHGVALPVRGFYVIRRGSRCPICRRVSRRVERRRCACRDRPPCTCRTPSRPPRPPRSAPPSRRRCDRRRAPWPGFRCAAGSPSSRAASETSTPVTRTGWHSGMSSLVRLSPAMAAMRAMPSTSPLPMMPAPMASSVSRCISTAPAAMATRSDSGLSPTSTMCACAGVVEVGELGHARNASGCGKMWQSCVCVAICAVRRGCRRRLRRRRPRCAGGAGAPGGRRRRRRAAALHRRGRNGPAPSSMRQRRSRP